MRLFVAIPLPAEVRADLWASLSPLRRQDHPIRWVSQDALHLTVHFLGSVAEPAIPSLAKALQTCVRSATPFGITVGGGGTFGMRGRIRTVWVGVQAPPALELLHHDVVQACDGVGAAARPAVFRPHVTLGRIKRRAGGATTLAGFTPALDDLLAEWSVMVDRIDLIRSDLTPRGPQYTVLQPFRLGP